MFGKIKGYMKNMYRYIHHGGFRRGGVTYVSVGMINDRELLGGRNVIVTGGSSGIGFAIAKRCIECGASVLITGRNEERLKKCTDVLGEKAAYYVCDVREVKEETYEKLLGRFRQVDCLVNNAGISPVSSAFPECKYDLYNDVLDTNLRGLYFLTQSYVRYCLKNDVRGTIVNVASNSGLVGLTSPYGLGKKAVVAFTEGIAKQYYGRGIRCNAVAPDVTLSNITGWSSKYDPEGNLYDGGVKHNRVFRAEEVAEVVLFLLSDRSVCVNGQTIACDNGGSLAENSVG